ncbi:hypothetical protein K502DRAFT_366329 [Neoconidiobolus thromboides FSU 785]|nr:hypothetical protein K502DRAFT_366329 [Neoconidiobolus thromboides FSU 785]
MGKVKKEKTIKKKEKKTKEGKEKVIVVKKEPLSGEFFNVKIKCYLSLSPQYSNDISVGINEFLNTFILKYMSQLDGIILAHSDTKLVETKGKIHYDLPFINFWITTKLLVWRPKQGSKLVGTITMQSADHIGLILHNTFNASIPASEIPKDLYLWKTQTGDYSSGEWVEVSNNKPLSAKKSIEFYVKELQTTNEVLTVNGSLLKPDKL